jgi:anti-sigma regulatory factor (Ser/Thr protein kinase)
MAATRSLLRAAGGELREPGKVLQRVNELLLPDIPARMFVTCLYGVLDPATGHIRFANAGHNLPFIRTDAGASEVRATGMPLGLMSGMHYDEVEARLAPGELLVLHSDGIAEAHGPAREMFGTARLGDTISAQSSGPRLIQGVLTSLEAFTGAGWEQEDDITLVSLQRTAQPAMISSKRSEVEAHGMLVEFELPSEPGNERLVMDRVADFVSSVGLSGDRLDKLKTAVSEAAMNAIEHGNEGRAELPVAVRLETTPRLISVKISDQGGEKEIPEAQTPDLEAKLSGAQSPRGWGLFLIKNMVDEMHVSRDGSRHTVELILHLEGASDGHE